MGILEKPSILKKLSDIDTSLGDRANKDDFYINVKDHGCKCDANYYNSSDGLYYSDASFTTLATDDSTALQSIISGLEGKPSKIFIGGRMCINTTVNISSGISITGGNVCARDRNRNVGFITTNNPNIGKIFNYTSTLIETYCDLHWLEIDNIWFDGNHIADYGFNIDGFGEVSEIKRCFFEYFNQSGVYVRSGSTMGKINQCSFFHCNEGLKLETSASYTLYNISGDYNTTSLITYRNGTPSALNIVGLKSENNPVALLIDNVTGGNIYISGATCNANISGTDVFIKCINLVNNAATPFIKCDSYRCAAGIIPLKKDTTTVLAYNANNTAGASFIVRGNQPYEQIVNNDFLVRKTDLFYNIAVYSAYQYISSTQLLPIIISTQASETSLDVTNFTTNNRVKIINKGVGNYTFNPMGKTFYGTDTGVVTAGTSAEFINIDEVIYRI